MTDNWFCDTPGYEPLHARPTFAAHDDPIDFCLSGKVDDFRMGDSINDMMLYWLL
jgi:hypothetical protein